MAKRKILLTGAGGSMGGAGLKELLSPERDSNFDITVLDLPTEQNRKKLQPYADKSGVKIIWGDLTNYSDVLEAVTGADFILHPAAFIPPAADHNPDLAWKVNVGAAENIVKAIKAQPDPDAVKLVNIGSVAETGDRRSPVHVGRMGDPIMPGIYDMYACAKVEAERIVAESGLRYWVSLRQTFITTTQNYFDPIMFHMPLDTCIEICTLKNAGLVLANVTNPDLPEEFWRRFYNIGSGPRGRTTFLDFMKKTLKLSGIKNLSEVTDRRWFAIQNFHSYWFEDAHVLNRYLNHHEQGIEDYFVDLEASMNLGQKLGALLTPKTMLKQKIFAPYAMETPGATQYWIGHSVEPRISAFYHSLDSYHDIPDWDVDVPEYPETYNYKRLDHGYDESKPTAELDLADMQQAAEFRGGQCLSDSMNNGDLFTKLMWQCAFDHQFEATPNLILKGGHWCPECAPPDWNYDEQARQSPFLAQVWHELHSPDEDNYYPREVVYDLQEGSN